MAKVLLRDLGDDTLQGRHVLVRCDLNVPLDDQGGVADDTRIEASLPTLRRLSRAGARIAVLSHLGRPKGTPDPAFSLAPVARRLGELVDAPVAFAGATIGATAEAAVRALEPGGIVVLENTRFDAREKGDDPAFAAALAEFGELYVNDAFGTAHRAHASTHGVARVIRERGGKAVAGYLLEKELRYLGDALDDPQRPFVAILGGAKISGKIDVIEALLPKVDRLLVGGAMANTFFMALGLEIGDSLVEPDRVEMARELLERAGDRLLLPVDVRVAGELTPDATPRVAPRDSVHAGERIADIGPESEALFADEVARAATVVWNGPMGVFEMAPFSHGTMAVARAVAAAGDGGAVTVVGGGDSVSAVHQAGVSERITHISTGGGASLELLSGNLLPGVEALSDDEENA